MLLAACSSLLVTIKGGLLQVKEGGFNLGGGLPQSPFSTSLNTQGDYQHNERYNYVTFQVISSLESLEGVPEEPAHERDFCSRG